MMTSKLAKEVDIQIMYTYILLQTIIFYAYLYFSGTTFMKVQENVSRIPAFEEIKKELDSLKMQFKFFDEKLHNESEASKSRNDEMKYQMKSLQNIVSNLRHSKYKQGLQDKF